MRAVDAYRTRLGLGLLAVVLVGGVLGIRVLLNRPPRPRVVAAAGQPELGFVRAGKVVATLDLPALQRLAAIQDVVGRDPYYERRKHFRALPLEPLLAAGFAEPLPALQQRDFILRARDGYAVPMIGSQLLGGGAHLAFADAEVPGWEPIGPQRANPGPFYLVWSRPEQGSLATHPRPWQLASIEIVDAASLFPHALPRGVGSDSPAGRGARWFRGRCIACHAINRDGGRVGPELNVPQSIVEYRPRAQILQYIRDPRVFRYGNMPAHPDLTDAQLADLMEYFTVMSTQKYDPEAPPPGAPPPPPRRSLMSEGSRLLLRRCAAAPAMLKAMLQEDSSAAPPPPRADLQLAQTLDPRLQFVITGIGTSEGPARLLAHLLTEHAGAAARFVPLSVFAGATLGEPVNGAAAVLVVFSQGLSPNAQLALTQSARFAAVLVYTSVSATDARVVALRSRGVTVAVLPPGEAATGSASEAEDQLFLRVLGPAAAQLAAAQLATAIAQRRGQATPLPLAAAVAAAASAQPRTQAALAQLGTNLVQRGLLTSAALDTYGLGALWQAQPQLPLALITSGGYGELCLGLRWKFLEGAGLSQPAAWDVLQVAHGPLQQTFPQPLLLCALSRGHNPVEQALLVRLQAMLPPHHILLHLPSQLPGPLALLEHDLACNELILAIRRGRNWNLLDWPGRLSDGPLYTLANQTELE